MVTNNWRSAGRRSPPLRVHLLFHPDSTVCAGIAADLFTLLNGPSTDVGPRIPVRMGLTDEGRPRPPALDSEHALVVVLVDARMARAATDDDRNVAASWGELVADLLERYPPGQSSACSVLPVAVDEKAFRLSPRLEGRSFVRLDAADRRHLDYHVVIGCLRLLAGRAASSPGGVEALPASGVRTFVSHAKRDLPRERWLGPVAALLAAHRDLPLEPWFDSSDIPPGAEFGPRIRAAVEQADAVIVVLTDDYSSREWCRIEVLAAKAAGRPVVVVDAITSRVVRLFPYLGNGPVVRWRAALAETASEDGPPPARAREIWEVEDAETALLVTLVEALRHVHEVVRLGAEPAAGAVLGTHPEAITLAAVPPGTSVLYPDPPLGREELANLARARPEVQLVTPLERLARSDPPAGFPLVAVSLSGAPDALRYGGSAPQLATLAHDVALYLLLSGFRLLYGGVPDHSAVSGGAPGDEVNYLQLLADLVERHSPLSAELGRHLQPIENWLAWPLHLHLSGTQRDEYLPDRARLVGRPPPELGVDADLLRRAAAPVTAGDDAAVRWVRARALTQMRVDSSAAASARIAAGGKLSGYSGVLPGVAEEALLTLRAGKPLFLLGAFGGAARAVVDVLRGEDRVELSSSWCAHHVDGWADLLAEYRRRDRTVATPDQLTDELRRRGAAGLGAVLANGLTDAENDELAVETDARRVVELVLTGLARRHEEPRGEAPGEERHDGSR